MKKQYALLPFLGVLLIFIIFSCSRSDSPEQYVAVSPVTVDLALVPYPNLSDYKFFTGAMKDLNPSLDVLPFQPASTLFTDYALKKRFIWMPKNLTANYVADNKTLNFPVGTVLIKNFYYNTIQPGNTTKIIETRLMIRKSTGWIFAEYLWNDAQTEAAVVAPADFTNGGSQHIAFTKPNGDYIETDYRIPSDGECLACHKINEIPTPIGVKPQNLNNAYTYADGSKNQLQKLVEQGYLASYPSNIVSTVDYHDTTKPLDLRLRSYVDINCAHCHQDQGRCDYRALRFGFGETTDLAKLGVCVMADETISPTLQKLISPGSSDKSVVFYRLGTNDEAKRMPLLGRTIIHDEGVALMDEYISSLTQNCE